MDALAYYVDGWLVACEASMHSALALALWMYLGQEDWDPDRPLFSFERARDKAAHYTVTACGI